MIRRLTKLLLLLCFLWVGALNVHAQTDSTSRSFRLHRDFYALAERVPAYGNEIDVSVTGFSVAELLKGIAISNGLSMAINLDKRKTITCNIRQIPVKDVLAFICAEKDIEAEFSGDIVTLTDYVAPQAAPPLKFCSDAADSSKVSFDIGGCTLEAVARAFNGATGCNLLYPTALSDKKVRAFGTGMTLDEAVKSIAAVNALSVRKDGDRVWALFEGGKERGAFSSSLFRDNDADKTPKTGVAVYAMKHRTVENVVELIPLSLKKDMEISAFADLNGIVISGDVSRSAEILDFLKEIDVSVPLISIDVMIVDATTSSAQSLGLGFGLGTEKGKNSATPLQSESYLWKEVEANFVLDITPYMSRDSIITLDVSLSQDEFTDNGAKDSEYAPPGISKRSFTSIIRVRDGEMVLLGGIDKNQSDNSSRGLPYASRVPVLRSIFGKTKKNVTDSKLSIFIKPTIL